MHQLPNQQSIQHTEPTTISYTSQQALQHLPNTQHMQQSTIKHPVIPHTLQIDMDVDEKPHDENTYYVCTPCETPTKFKDYST